MNGNSRNQNDCDDENLFGIMKKTNWEIYGVKRFPYRGKNKFTPLLYQSLDGGMVISNDVFGLTISQFEQMYKACIERRKTKEQWIINLRHVRYPDKSSKEYLEYLKNCTDCHKDHLRWIDLREKHLYENLVQIVGTELDIRKRQRLFIIQDRIVNSSGLNETQIFSGSLAEGLDLPGSDINNVNVITNVKDIPKQTNNRKNAQFVVMETDIMHPGFTRLRSVERQNGKYVIETCYNCPSGSCEQGCLSSKDFLDNVPKFPNMATCVHGPCISNLEQTVDLAFCIRSKFIPSNAIPWASRHRCQWPPNCVINQIINYGCLLVPIGPKILSNNESLWRMSFSVAEKLLVHSFNFTQFLCYGLLKLTFKRIINTNYQVKDLLCSYYLKTALFWVSEEVNIETFQLSKVYYCFSRCLTKIISWVNTCYCPNFFIPEHNMFLGKINQSNNAKLLCLLKSIQDGGINGLIQHLFLNDNDHHCLLSTKSKYYFVQLDFLLYRHNCYMRDIIPKVISNYHKSLSSIESILKSESCTFIIDACQWYKDNISRQIVHLLPTPNTKGKKNTIHKCYHRHLQRIIKMTDAVSGWLLYASFYYVTGQFNVTLRLTDYILSKWSPDLMYIDYNDVENEITKNKYRHNVHTSMSFNERLKIATAQHVHYEYYSPLIPEELKPEVECKEHEVMNVLPNVMCNCLRFLCYHHLGDISQRQQTLRELYKAVHENWYRPYDTESNTLTIIGVCYELSGDKDMAYQCYDEALQCKIYVCPSAEARRSKLFEF